MSEVGHMGPSFEVAKRVADDVFVRLTRSEVLVMLWALGDLAKNGQVGEKELANDLWRKMYGLYGTPRQDVKDGPLVTLNESVWD